jgi:hypothetical protein
MGCKFGALAKVHTSGESMIGFGVLDPVFDGYGTVPQADSGAGVVLPPPHPATIATIANRKVNRDFHFGFRFQFAL